MLGRMTQLTREFFVRQGREGGKTGARKLTAAERSKKARAAGIASGKARRKKAKQRQSAA